MAVTESTGHLVNTYGQDLWGDAGTVETTTLKYQPFRYTGEQSDAESGLTYLRARYYDPAAGRFMSRDTFGGYARKSQSQNRYTYTGNNPASLVDPSGRVPEPNYRGCIGAHDQWSAFAECEMIPVGAADYDNSGPRGWFAAPNMPSGFGGSRYYPSPGGPGKWIRRPQETMTPAAREAQRKLTGVEDGWAYELNGYHWDSFQNGKLIEAKGNYRHTVGEDGRFKQGWYARDQLRTQARNQLGAAKGTPIEWRFSDEATYRATQYLFAEEGITGIDLVLVP